MKYLLSIVLSLAAAAPLLAAEPVSPAVAKRTQWFHDARWGVFGHYLFRTEIHHRGRAEQATNPADEKKNLDAWNDAVDHFDVEGLADELASVHAGYYVITLGQNTGFYLSPNAAYDRFVGRSPSRLSHRDLVADLSKALAKRGIPLMVYLPSGAPDRDKLAMSKLKWQKGDHRNAEFQVMWQQVIREWSLRWGSSVKGWWFDGCYHAATMYPPGSEPNFTTFAAAARAGNPDAILAFNSGTRRPLLCLSPEQDYTAGECNKPLTVGIPSRWADGGQAHILSFLGRTWGSPDAPRFTDEQVAAWTKQFITAGGVVSWDTRIEPNGHLGPKEFKQLAAIDHAVRGK